MGLPRSPDIDYLGFVDDERKLALMAGALAFVLPSQYESFSIVTLEAMAQRTPVLVNGRCEVLRDHIEHSGGGFHYACEDDLIDKMEHLCTLDADERARIGAARARLRARELSRGPHPRPPASTSSSAWSPTPPLPRTDP